MVQVEIALYDLLPPGKLSTAFYYFGVGIYHTSVRIPELQVEFAYGGILPGSQGNRDVSNLTGIFVLPSPDDPRVTERLMPGLRFLQRIDVGEAFGAAWERNVNSRQESRRPHSLHKPLPPLPDAISRKNKRHQRYKNNLSSSSSSGNLPLLPYHESLSYSEDQSFSSMITDERGRKLSSPPSAGPRDMLGSSSGQLATSPTTYAPPGGSPFSDQFENSLTSTSLPVASVHSSRSGSASIRLSNAANDLTEILALVEDMKREAEWSATRYHLLLKNCNSFTSELCFRLTGKKAPAWLNRAAWLAQSLPCLVPAGWLDPPTAEELQEVSLPVVTTTGDAPGTERPTSPLIAVPYVHTSAMHVDVHCERVAQ